MMNDLQLLDLRRRAAMLAPDAGTGAQGGEEGQGAQGVQDDEGGQEAGEKAGEKKFTREDIDRIVGREKAKWSRQQKKAIDDARTEAERLAKMTTEERAAEEARKREGDLTRREQELNRREMRAQMLDTLAERGLPAELADMIDYTDAEKADASLKKLEKAFRDAVQRGVEDRIRGGAPKAGGGKGQVDGVTAAFARLNPNLKIE